MQRKYSTIILLQIALFVTCFVFFGFQTDKGIVLWSANRKLTFEDFKGKISSDDRYVVINQKKEGEVDAGRSRIAISLNFQCNNGKANHKITTEFEQFNSWIVPEYRNEQSLNHEQGHFDIAEIFARKLKKEIAGMSNQCDHDKVAELYSKIDSEHVEFNRQYDIETSHSCNKLKQKEWDLKLQSLLK